MKRFPFISGFDGFGVDLVVDDSAYEQDGNIYVPANTEYGFDVVVPTDRVEFVLLIGGRNVSLRRSGVVVSDSTDGTITLKGIPVTPAATPDGNLIDGFKLLDDGPEKIDIALYNERPLEPEAGSRSTDASNAKAHSVQYGGPFRRGRMIAHFEITLVPVALK